MQDGIQSEISDLLNNKIWVSKKCRMEAEDRMNRNNIFSKFLVNYYTFVVLAVSIWELIIRNSTLSSRVSVLTVIASVGLFGTTLFISSFGYREKALQYRESYLSLSKLETDVKQLLRQDDLPTMNAAFSELENKYNDILSKTDNHHAIDYWKVRIERNIDLSMSFVRGYYLRVYVKRLIQLLLIALPIIAISLVLTL